MKKLKSLRKILSMSLAAALTVSLAACGGGGAASGGEGSAPAAGGNTDILNPVGTYPIVKEPIELKIFTISAPNVENLETNDFTKFLEEKTGIKLKFEQATRDNYKEKLNLALSTNDYPDIINWFSTGVDVAKYGVKEGIFIQLDDLIEPNMPNYIKMLGDKVNLAKQTDGHMYSLVTVNDCYHCMYGKKLWVNTMWLDKMGMKEPTTTEEFYEVCKKFMEINPTGIAVGGTAPRQGWYSTFEDFLINAFVLAPKITQNFADWTAVDGNGKVVTVAATEEYREALKYIKSLYDIGAIYEGDFTQTEEQLKTLVNQPDEPVLFVAAGTISNHIDATANPELYSHYSVLEPIKGPKGVQIATEMKYDGISEGGFYVTDKCKYPEAALRWADYFFTTEGSLSAQFGADEGKDWVLAPEGKFGLNGEPALYEILNKYSGEPQNHDWQDVSICARPNDFRLGSATEQDVDWKTAEGLEQMLYVTSKEKMAPHAQDPKVMDIMPKLKLTDEEASKIQTVGVEIEKSIAESRVAFITGTKSLDTDWDAYIKGMDNMGLQTLIEAYQVAYDRQMKS